MNVTKVLHVITSIDPKSGGTATTFFHLCMAEARAGIDVTAVSTHRAGEDVSWAQTMRDAGVKVELIGPTMTPLSWSPKLAPKIRDLVAKNDIVHVHAVWEEIQYRATVEARKQGKPYIMLPQGMLDPWSLAQKKWKKKIYMALRSREMLNRATAIHLTANAERDLVAPLNLQAPVIIEPLAVDLAEFEKLPPKGWLRQKYPQIKDRPIILYLSRLHYKKGLDLLIPAFAQANTNDAVLVLAGPADPSYLQQLQDEVKKHNLTDRVIFTGMIHGEERVQFYVDADLFVLPSYQENFGIVVVEALASACPVLISDRVNIFDKIQAADVGCIVQTDIDSVREGLTRWMTDPQLRQAASARARPFVWENYNWQASAERWKSHYTRIIGQSAVKQVA